MQFSYTAVATTGQRKKGIIEANSEKQVVDYLKEGGLTPINIKKRSENGLLSLNLFKKVKGSDIVIFTRQLASMMQTGLTLIESLNILKNQIQNQELQNVITDIVGGISEGKSFSQALENHKNVFPETYISLIRAAESGGLLHKILARLADNLEASEDLQKRVRSALFYPLIIIVGVIGVIAIMNILVIPQLSSLYTSLNVELPWTTQLVVNTSHIFIKYWIFAIPGGFIGYLMFSKAAKTQIGIRVMDKIKLKLPVFGDIVRLSVLDEISRTLSLLVRAGLSIINALEITANVAGNVYYKEAMINSSRLVEKGISLSKAFQNQEIFPEMLIQMTKVGEETGKVDDSLEKLAQYFQRDLDLKIKTLTQSLEPIIIVFLGVIVGFIIISVITPIYTLINAIQ